MENYYLKNGKEVKMGDTITVHDDEEHPILGKIHSTITVLVNDYTVDALVKEGYLFKQSPTSTLNIEIILDIIAKKHKWDKKDVISFLNTMETLNVSSAFTILLKTIAVELDKKYEDHISNSPRIFCVSLTDGKICEINKAHIRNYKNFAAFRTVEDAKEACKILKPYFKTMYAKK